MQLCNDVFIVKNGYPMFVKLTIEFCIPPKYFLKNNYCFK